MLSVLTVSAIPQSSVSNTNMPQDSVSSTVNPGLMRLEIDHTIIFTTNLSKEQAAYFNFKKEAEDNKIEKHLVKSYADDTPDCCIVDFDVTTPLIDAYAYVGRNLKITLSYNDAIKDVRIIISSSFLLSGSFLEAEIDNIMRAFKVVLKDFNVYAVKFVVVESFKNNSKNAVVLYHIYE